MATSDAQKEASYRYKRKNMHFATVQVPNKEWDALKAACAASGVTPHSVFLAAARAYIAAHPSSDAASVGDADAGPVEDSDGSSGSDEDAPTP